MNKGDIYPITLSKFDRNAASNYNHCYASLMTVDEIREMNRQKMKKASFKYEQMLKLGINKNRSNPSLNTLINQDDDKKEYEG